MHSKQNKATDDSYFNRLLQILKKPTPAYSLAVFRAGFGVIMVWHLLNKIWPVNNMSAIQYLYVDTTFHFKYPGFGWVSSFSEPWMTLYICLLVLFAFLLTVGFLYRIASCGLFLGYTYFFLMEAAQYNNHYYLICLIAGLLCCMPANATWSIDAFRCRKKDANSSNISVIPFWTIFLLRAQIFIVYFYGGLAKIDSDWLTGIPLLVPAKQFLIILQTWLPISSQLDVATCAIFMAWFGLIFDLSIGFLLLIRRTRFLAIALLLCFHGTNLFLFPIGIFPVLGVWVSLIFLETDWPIRVTRWFRRPSIAKPNWTWAIIGFVTLPILGFLLGWTDSSSKSEITKLDKKQYRVPVVLIILFLLVQICFPMRHLCLSRNANWSEEGQDFSWRMMLRAKSVGHVVYYVDTPEMIYKDTQGISRINWKRWPEARPKQIVVPIDAPLFDWNDHPGLTVTYEPCLGYRVIHPVPLNATFAEIDQRKQTIQRQWKQAFGAAPVIRESQSLPEILQVLQQHCQTLTEEWGVAYVEALQTLEKNIASEQPLSEKTYASLTYTLHNLLKRIPSLEHKLQSVNPFELQGAKANQWSFLIVSIPKQDKISFDFTPLTSGKPCLIWSDIARLPVFQWKQLPHWFAVYEMGKLRIVWNQFIDLNHIQLTRFGIRPLMLKQYADHIAERWEIEQGARPQVFVSSFVMMNYRTPQPIVSSEVDLANISYNLYGSNEWILPLKAAPLRISDWNQFDQTP